MAKIEKAQKPEPEIYPDAWSRFERATDVVVKAPPQHRTAKPKKASRKAGAVKQKRRANKNSL